MATGSTPGVTTEVLCTCRTRGSEVALICWSKEPGKQKWARLSRRLNWASLTTKSNMTFYRRKKTQIKVRGKWKLAEI